MSVPLAMTVNGKPVSADSRCRARCSSISCATNWRSPARTSAAIPRSAARAPCIVDGTGGEVVQRARRCRRKAPSVVTIEGLIAEDGTMHPMQAAFRECHGLQCGFCTPGMVMSAIDLVNRHPRADEATIRAELDGNICRCTGYHNIVKAVRQGAAVMGK